MTNLSKNFASNESLFDAIRHEDEQKEYWLARELMGILGYPRWSDFKDAIERSKASCENAGNLVTEHFSGLFLKNPSSSQGRKYQDYRLSRYACYLIAMNGDPRKDEIAQAQAYFTVKIREAETASPNQDVELEKLRLEADLVKAKIRLMETEKAYQESSYWIVKAEGLAMLQYYRGGELPALPPVTEPEKVFVNDRGDVIGSSQSRTGITGLLKAAGYSEKESRSTNLQKHAKQVLAEIGIDFDSGAGLDTAMYIRTHKVCPESRIQDAIAALVQVKAQMRSIWTGGLDLGL